MYSKEIVLENLVNGKTAVFEPHEIFNIIVGDNGTGKSDLIKRLEEYLKNEKGENVYNLTALVNNCTNKEMINLLEYYVRENFSKTNSSYIDCFLSEATRFCKSKIIYEDGELLIIRRGDKRELDWLSSGELKYLLLILPVCLSEDNAVIFVADDIEIHLSIWGQEILLENLHELNENAQFFVTTHSPSIFVKHEADVIYIDDILKD